MESEEKSQGWTDSHYINPKFQSQSCLVYICQGLFATWKTCLKVLGFTGLLASRSYICRVDEMHSLQINGAVQRSFKVGFNSCLRKVTAYTILIQFWLYGAWPLVWPENMTPWTPAQLIQSQPTKMLMSSIRDLYLENQDTHLHHLVFNQSIYWKRSPMFSRGQLRRGDWSVDIGRALKVNRCGHSSYVASMRSSSSGVVHNKACSSEQTPKRHVLWWGWDICGFQYEHNWWLHKKENLYFDFL